MMSFYNHQGTCATGKKQGVFDFKCWRIWILGNYEYVAHPKILILLKGHFTINKRRSGVWRALQFQMVWMILDAAFFYFRVIPDVPKIYKDKKHKDFIIFTTLGRMKRILELRNQQSWAYRSLKSLNRSSLLSEPSFWEQWRSLRQRAERSERTDKIKFWAVRSWVI